ncbi:MAG: copper-binding protein [Rubrivivax sp.]
MRRPITFALLAAAVSLSALAQDGASTDGEVRKVDKGAGKITLKHEPIKNLAIPAMTMVFRADAAMLDKVKAGDRVKFKAEKSGGAIVITEIRIAP